MTRKAPTAAAKKRAKGKAGAPQKYDRAATVQAICKHLLDGKPMALACRELGIPLRTVNHWRAEDAEIAADFDEAFEAGGDTIAWRMRMTARGKKNKDGGDSTGDTDRDKLIIYTDEKLLANWHTRYSRRVTLAGDKENPLVTQATQLSEAQLLAIAAQGMKDDGKDG